MSTQTYDRSSLRRWALEVSEIEQFSPAQVQLVWMLAVSVNERWESDVSIARLSSDAGMSVDEVRHHLEILRENNVVSWFARVGGEWGSTPFTLNRSFPEAAVR